jgi:hypothetical protein
MNLNRKRECWAMLNEADIKPLPGRFSLPSFEEQLQLMERHRLATLLFCPDAWALRHNYTNRETGEVIRARCDKWTCLYCGPRKVNQWRRLVKAAEPTLFVTLTSVGWTLKEAARVYTTVLQYLRRGSKGRGPNYIGARRAYPIECFSILEEHKRFVEVGFHWHILVKGIDYLPKQVVSDALRSATHGRSYIVDVQRVEKAHAVGYVTKYLTKELADDRRGTREVQREVVTLRVGDAGEIVEDRVMQTDELPCKARRIRYTRHFFPESTATLRMKLFSEIEGAGDMVIDDSAAGVTESAANEISQEEAGQEQEGQAGETVLPASDGMAAPKRSTWMLSEHAPFSTDIKDYRERRRLALIASLEDLRARKPMYSRRVVSIWDYQRKGLRLAG